MTDSNKRKERQGDDRDSNRGPKKSKGGSGGKWKTPHQITKGSARRGGRIDPGDMGIWVTCAKGQEGRATEEVKVMFEECAYRFYGIATQPSDKAEDDNDDSSDDVEATIRKELQELDTQKFQPKLFTPVHINAPCVLFFKTCSPIDPVDFVRRICTEITTEPGVRRMRYVNRLTPMTLMGKATESGLGEVGRAVLSQHFRLSEEHKNNDAAPESTSNLSYAIRPTIRTHKELKRDEVIKQIASMVEDSHKVNLTKPDKVILVEIYQTVCGMSVVGDDWEALKRYNLAELYGGYKQAIKDAAVPVADAIPKIVSTGEASREDVQSTDKLEA